jgi:hypothetical protein
LPPASAYLALGSSRGAKKQKQKTHTPNNNNAHENLHMRSPPAKALSPPTPTGDPPTTRLVLLPVLPVLLSAIADERAAYKQQAVENHITIPSYAK